MIFLTFNILNNTAARRSGAELHLNELLKISSDNTKAILRILENNNVKATFFVEVSIATHLQDLLKIIKNKGHEISLFNSGSDWATVREVKDFLEMLLEKKIRGMRQNQIVLSTSQLKELEFSYISDIENANILFPFKRLTRGTEIVEKQGISIIPESISPYSQIPYNDFVFQTLPMKYYQNMVAETLKNEEYCLIYLNTWQFTDAATFDLKIPFYRKYNSGRKMEDKLEEFVQWINTNDYATSRLKDYLF